MSRSIACLLAICLCVLNSPSRSQEPDDAVKGAAVSAARAQLDPFALFMNERFYTSFQIAPGDSAQNQNGGFAPVIAPRGSAIVRAGLLEVASYPWSVAMFPDRSGGWNGVVILRLASYRIADRETGRLSQDLLSLHLWQWNVATDGAGAIRASPKMDQTSFPTDNGLRELVASIFNVSPTLVTVGRPDATAVSATFGQTNPGAVSVPLQQGCRPCETLQPNGSCRQWRAC